ncbi:multidrug efflux SMR transporter [Limosilactobacillus coleohominis]|uniref:DMT family transporter n=1 Tax=Limosilactobacillus coleohominis TaxID=181675 RepID=UPI0026F2E311|nr:multidrug efflux SMR transporter [Limosilactobacillus coleohominis]
MGYFQLAIALVMEVIGTNFMKASVGFSKPIPTLLTIIAYVTCFYSFAQCLKEINLSIAYATWGGLGIILTTVVAVVVWHNRVTIPELIGIGLIVIGVVICNVSGN